MGFAYLDKPGPFVFTALCLECIPLVDPLQKIPNRISTGEKGIKIILTQVFPFQKIKVFVEQSMQSRLHGIFGFVVLSHIQTESALIGFQKSKDCPVLGVYLGPDDPAILKFCKRFKVFRTGLYRPKVLAAHTRQIDDWENVAGQHNISDFFGYYTAKPDSGAGSVCRIVIT